MLETAVTKQEESSHAKSAGQYLDQHTVVQEAIVEALKNG